MYDVMKCKTGMMSYNGACEIIPDFCCNQCGQQHMRHIMCVTIDWDAGMVKERSWTVRTIVRNARSRETEQHDGHFMQPV
jgi:hypothetical protein